jgi:hypothetical protein
LRAQPAVWRSQSSRQPLHSIQHFIARQRRTVDKALQRGLAITPAPLVGTNLIAFLQPQVEIALQLLDARVDLAAKGPPIQLVDHGAMGTLDDAVGLGAFDLGVRMIDVLDCAARGRCVGSSALGIRVVPRLRIRRMRRTVPPLNLDRLQPCQLLTDSLDDHLRLVIARASGHTYRSMCCIELYSRPTYLNVYAWTSPIFLKTFFREVVTRL